MKHRVHELAKQLGVPSVEVLARLAELGEFVKSASSTLEEPVVHRLYQLYGVSHPALNASYTPQPSAPHPAPGAPRVANNPYTPRSVAPLDREASTPLRMVSPGPRRANAPRVASNPFGVGGGSSVPREAFSPAPRRPKKPRREWYRGPKPSELQLLALRAEILPQRDLLLPPANIPEGRYFEDEVEAARNFEESWREAVLFLTLPEIEDWVRLLPTASLRDALGFHEAGMTARDASLQLWYGRPNSERPTVFEQVKQGSLSIADAARYVHQFRAKSGDHEVRQAAE